MSSSYQRLICVWVVQLCAWQPMPGATSRTILLSTTWSSRLPAACSSNPCRLVNGGTTTSSSLATLNAWSSAMKTHRLPVPSPTTPTQTRRRGSSWKRGSLCATSKDVVHMACTCLSRTCSERWKARSVATQNQRTLTTTRSTTFTISSKIAMVLSNSSITTTRLKHSLVNCRRPRACKCWWRLHQCVGAWSKTWPRPYSNPNSICTWLSLRTTSFKERLCKRNSGRRCMTRSLISTSSTI